MAKKYIDKKTVLKAIKTEPLKAGSWVEFDKFYNPMPDPDCEVCAVGAVLRNAGLDNEEIEDFGNNMINVGPVSSGDFNHDRGEIEEAIDTYLDEKRFLHALSLKFEYTACKLGNGERTRKVLEKFVNENFPAKVLLDEGF